MKRRRKKSNVSFGVGIIVFIIALGFMFNLMAYGGEPQLSAVQEIKSQFNEAMAKPLGDRIKPLEDLEQLIDDKLFDQTFSGKDRVEPLWLLFRVQQELAKYPESRETFGQYVSAIKLGYDEMQASNILKSTFNRYFRRDDKVECINLINKALETYSDDLRITPFLLFLKSQSLGSLNGRLDEAIAPLETIIADFFDSKFRPKAMRLLSIIQLQQGKSDNALSTLSLIEQQYKGTWWEQYAHLKPAMVFEDRQGDPQKAFERLHLTLQKFPHHCFGPFIRSNIERLQKVIEEQLIIDAIGDIAKADDPTQRFMEQMFVYSASNDRIRTARVIHASQNRMGALSM